MARHTAHPSSQSEHQAPPGLRCPRGLPCEWAGSSEGRICPWSSSPVECFYCQWPQSGKTRHSNPACLPRIMRRRDEEGGTVYGYGLWKMRELQPFPDTGRNHFSQQVFCLLQPTQVLSRFSSSSLTSLTPEVSGSKITLPAFLGYQIVLLGDGWEVGEEISEPDWPRVDNC